MQKTQAVTEPESLASRFRKVEWQVTRNHGQALEQYGVNMYQAMSLIYVARHGDQLPVNQRAIERYLYLSNPGVSKIISFLERQGYVVRNPDPSDARSYVLKATEAGHAFAGTLNRAIAEADEAVVARLTEAERATLLRLFQKIGEEP